MLLNNCIIVFLTQSQFWIAEFPLKTDKQSKILKQLLHSCNTYTTIHIYMRKHSQHNNDERTHFFRKIYLSHFVAKGLCERGELETEQTATYWPPVPLSFSFCWATQSGVLRAHSSLLGLVLSTASWLQLTEHPVAPGYIIVWCPPASCECRICTQFSLSTVKVISWYLRPDAPVPWSTAGSKVNMLHNHEWTKSHQQKESKKVMKGKCVGRRKKGERKKERKKNNEKKGEKRERNKITRKKRRKR